MSVRTYFFGDQPMLDDVKKTQLVKEAVYAEMPYGRAYQFFDSEVRSLIGPAPEGAYEAQVEDLFERFEQAAETPRKCANCGESEGDWLLIDFEGQLFCPGLCDVRAAAGEVM